MVATAVMVIPGHGVELDDGEINVKQPTPPESSHLPAPPAEVPQPVAQPRPRLATLELPVRAWPGLQEKTSRPSLSPARLQSLPPSLSRTGTFTRCCLGKPDILLGRYTCQTSQQQKRHDKRTRGPIYFPSFTTPCQHVKPSISIIT